MSRLGGFAARLLAALVLLVALQSAALAAFQVNDRVQAWVSGVWYDGTIVGLGEGDYAGEYYVTFDKGGRSYYVNSDSLRALAPAGPLVPGETLTPAIYECFAQGQYFFLRLGSGLDYQQTEPAAAPGLYELDTATGIIRFTTGPYSIGKWTAEIHNGPDQAGITLHADQDYDCKAAR